MRARALALVMVGVAGVGGAVLGGARVLRPIGAASANATMNGSSSSGLRNQHGVPFAMDQLRGDSVVLHFIFTHCPGICPTQTRALGRVRAALPEDVRERVHFVSVSVDPERDTPEALAAFAAKHGVAEGKWSFVTGPAQQLSALADNYSARALPSGAGPLDHRTEVRLINAEGRVMQTYSGNPLDEPRLAREIQSVDELFRQKALR